MAVDTLRELKRTEQYTKRLGRMKLERSSFESHWKDLTDNLLPRSGRYILEDRNRGLRRNLAIYDSTATRALNVLAAGMMSGMSSPSLKWVDLELSNPKLNDDPDVKIWLEESVEIIQEVFARSNVYRVLHGLYEELATFGTACAMLFEDKNDIIRHYPQTAGEYYIAQNDRYVVDTVYRE